MPLSLFSRYHYEKGNSQVATFGPKYERFVQIQKSMDKDLC